MHGIDKENSYRNNAESIKHVYILARTRFVRKDFYNNIFYNKKISIKDLTEAKLELLYSFP